MQEFTKSFIGFADMTQKVAVPKGDWVLSLEMGEHVPNRFEAMVIRNIHAHNTRGVILSWARLGQPGNGHVNNHSRKVCF